MNVRICSQCAHENPVDLFFAKTVDTNYARAPRAC
jgi:hypothetical protein